MSYNPYSVWGSASSSESQAKSEGGGWWRSTKDAFKKPWKRKSEKASQQQQQHDPRHDPWGGRAYHGAFPPFISQMAPGVFQHERRRSSNPEDKLAKQLSRATPSEQAPKGHFDLPEYEGQRRPRLDSVFPIHDTPPAIKSPAPPPNIGTRQGGGGGGAVGKSSSFNEADVVFEERRRERRREKAAEASSDQEREETDGGGGGGGEEGVPARKESVDSEDRTLERRKRRLGAVRELPKLPLRTGYEWNEVRSLPEVSHRHRRQRRPTPAHPPMDRRGMEAFPLPYPRLMCPPRGPLSTPRGAHNFSYPLWDSPADSLPTLAEESDSGEIKGFDNFILY